MQTKETYKVQKSASVLLANKHYFNYVFKKTEKIVCVVLYILHNNKDTKGHIEQLVSDIKSECTRTLDTVLKTLPLEPHEAKRDLIDVAGNLVSLQSRIRMGTSSGIFSEEYAEVLTTEIEGVMRVVSRYAEDEFPGVLTSDTTANKNQMFSDQTPLVPSRSTTSPRSQSQAAASDSKTHTTRQDQISEIIRTKKTVSIKDVAEEIKDCSEKTIQRELNAMIEKGLVKREGERRWSRYSLI